VYLLCTRTLLRGKGRPLKRGEGKNATGGEVRVRTRETPRLPGARLLAESLRLVLSVRARRGHPKNSRLKSLPVAGNFPERARPHGADARTGHKEKNIERRSTERIKNVWALRVRSDEERNDLKTLERNASGEARRISKPEHKTSPRVIKRVARDIQSTPLRRQKHSGDGESYSPWGVGSGHPGVSDCHIVEESRGRKTDPRYSEKRSLNLKASMNLGDVPLRRRDRKGSAHLARRDRKRTTGKVLE